MNKLYRQLLNEFISFPSISTDPGHKKDIQNTVDWLHKQFFDRGFQVSILNGPNSNPVVVARYDAKCEDTILVYGHYDIQPAGMDQGWTGDPFVVRAQDGCLVARGVVDNKGQTLIHMVSVFEHIKAGTLRYSVVFVLEGNEETSNPDLPELLKQNKDLVACNGVLISDGEIAGDSPTLDVSLRGGFNIRVQLRTAKNDMHSGLVGGAVPNAAQVLTQILAKIHNSSGGVLIPEFYEGVNKPSQAVLENHGRLMELNPPLAILPVNELLSADGTDFYTQTGLYPTIQVSGVASGYTGQGFANIVPAVAEARLNVRLVAGQDVEQVSQRIQNYLRSLVPDYADIILEVNGLHQPVSLDVKSAIAKRAEAILMEVYKAKPIYKYVGGAIPVVLDFKQTLGASPLLVSLGNDDCNMHGPDENFRIDLIQRGLEFSRRFFAKSDQVK